MSRIRAAVGVAVGLACASPPPPLPAGVSPLPAVGDPLALVLDKLEHATGAPPADLAIEELRLLSVARQPWRRVDREDAAGTTGPLVIVAGRRCRVRDGIQVDERARASWLLLRDGAVLAFDHDDFAADCSAVPSYVPAPQADLQTERMLVRFVSQRWPGDGATPDERLPRGLALLAAERPDDALLELHAFDRQIQEIERRRDEAEDATERERWSRELARLGPQRAQLHHALREAREREGETAWDG